MRKTTRLKKPQIPELDTLYQFNDLGGRPKYGGVEMTSATNIPSFDEIRDETHSMVVAEATARDDADDALQAQIDDLSDGLSTETDDRIAADNNLQSEIDAIVAASDVKDIVGTKAELDNYDTSTLGDNDIIKVLQDETQQDQTTYYRWGAAAEAFTLIGAEGPYYTKAATNNLLNAKADKTAIGTPKKLTANDYNWNSTNKSTSGTLDSFALWLLEDGLYSFEAGTPISKLKTDKNNSVPGAVPGSTSQAPTILIMSGVDAFSRTIKTFFGVASQGANPDGKSVFFAIRPDFDDSP